VLGLRRVAGGQQLTNSGISRELLESLLEDVAACLQSIEASGGRKGPWRYAGVLHGFMRKVLNLGEGGQLDLGLEEVAVLSQLRDVGS
jgi:hypothetical protein